MADAPGRADGRLARLVARLGTPQHRTTLYLMLNNVTGAAAGFLFWLLLARVAGLSPSEVGVGYAVVALGTTIGLVSKGGLDTALIRKVPGASHRDGVRLLGFGILVGGTVAVALSLALATFALPGGLLPELRALGWALVALIAVLLVVTWLQDAHFLAEGDARATFGRNLVFSAARLLLPVPVVLLALPLPVPLTWMIALLASAMVALVLSRRHPDRQGRRVPRREFLQSATRNITGSAAEFLPGLLLVPLVLAVGGAESAGHFGIAWTAASLLFLASAAVGRSALSEMVRNGPGSWPATVRRGALQSAVVLVPAAVAGALLAPWVMALFGSSYTTAAAPAFAILCISTLFVAPAYLYLAVLRAQEKPLVLVVFPAAMVAALLVLAPAMQAQYGLVGVAAAWLLSNVPFGLWATQRLWKASRGVIDHVPPVGGAAHLE